MPRMRTAVHVQSATQLLMRIAWQLHGPPDPIADCHAQRANRNTIQRILAGKGVEREKPARFLRNGKYIETS